jgi:hypothetical protein
MDSNNHQELFKLLVNLLGPENVENAPGIMNAYMRDMLPPGVVGGTVRPEFVVLPGSTKEVQNIIKIANRYKLLFIPVGSNLWSVSSAPTKPRTIIIDPKRMNRILEIDEKNMYAVIEPYVSHAQLIAEANKKGLYIGSPDAGAQASSLANHTFQGIWGVSHRLGMAYRNILSTEWVLPNGEILTTGSLSMGQPGCFSGMGPGPDLRGMLRGLIGTLGGFGMVTKMAVKLHPWPGPKVFPCEGYIPSLKAEFPKDYFKWYLINYPTLEKAGKALYEISRAEIGGTCHKWPTIGMNWWWAKSNEEFWNTWKEAYWQNNCKHLLAVSLWGFTSKKQVEYEVRVIEDIIAETKGELVTDEAYKRFVPYVAANMIRDSNGPRVMRATGTFLAFTIAADTIHTSIENLKRQIEFIDKYTPPLVDCDHPDKIGVYEFGHFAHGEDLFAYEKTPEDCQAVIAACMDMIQQRLQERLEMGIGPGLGGIYHGLAGKAFFNYHTLLEGIKKAIDPDNLANPPHPIPPED